MFHAPSLDHKMAVEIEQYDGRGRAMFHDWLADARDSPTTLEWDRECLQALHVLVSTPGYVSVVHGFDGGRAELALREAEEEFVEYCEQHGTVGDGTESWRRMSPVRRALLGGQVVTAVVAVGWWRAEHIGG